MTSSESTNPHTHIPVWERDHDRELEDLRTKLGESLDAAEDAVRRAAQAAADLIDGYDVDIAEGPGVAAPDVLAHLAITIAGVRATTVWAGRNPS